MSGVVALLRSKRGQGEIVDPPPDPPDPPTGDLWATADFDSGGWDGFQTGTVGQQTHVGDGGQFGNFGTTGYGNMFWDSSVVGQGTKSMRVESPASSANPGGELLMARQLRLGVREFYGFMIRWPTNWVEPSTVGWGSAHCQFNYAGLQNHNLGIFAHSNRVDLILLTGEITRSGAAPNFPSVTFEYNNGLTDNNTGQPTPTAIPSSRWELGVWHKLIFDIQWATGFTGHVRVHHKKPGETSYTQTVEKLNIPTVAWGPGIHWPANNNHYMNEDGTARGTGAEWRTVDKIGFYRGPSPTPLSVWHDRYCKGSTFSIVEARLG
jgi:hypothetical protein